MKRKVLVIGDSYMNLQMSVPAAVKSSETVYGDKYAFHPCGSSAVSAVTAAKSGADCAFCTRLGDDSNGEKLYNYYKSCGVDTTFVKKMPNVQTGLEFTAYDNLNSLSYITKGANVYLSKADIDDAFSCCPDARFARLYRAVRREQGRSEHVQRHVRGGFQTDRSAADGASRKSRAVRDKQSSRARNRNDRRIHRHDGDAPA